jgi:hypothetical protein
MSLNVVIVLVKLILVVMVSPGGVCVDAQSRRDF